MPRKDKKRGTAEPNTPDTQTKRLTPLDVQQKEFRVSSRPFRGYDEQEVDEFLDLVTEELARLHAENRRLQEDVEFRRTVPVDRDTALEADEVVRKAREEAARILAEVEARAERLRTRGRSDPGSIPGRSVDAVNRFLAREREFLQGLAGLIQQHAESVKADARSLRPTSDRPAEPAPPDTSEESEPVEIASDDAAGVESTFAEAAAEAEPDVAASGIEEEPSDEEPVVIPDEPEPGSELEAFAEGAEETDGGAGSHGQWAVRGMAGAAGTSHRWQEERAQVGRASDATAAMTATALSADDDTDEDRSLRELFWGED
jgi:DivIVA domain-containing protein